MNNRLLILFISLTLLGNIPCMADAWQDANSRAARSASGYGFSSVATMPTSSAQERFRTNSSAAYSAQSPRRSFPRYSICESGIAENISLMARSLENGMTADEALAKNGPRRTIINDDDYGDDDNRPGYDPNDPFFTPVGDIPWPLIALLCTLLAGITMLRIRRKQVKQTNG